MLAQAERAEDHHHESDAKPERPAVENVWPGAVIALLDYGGGELGQREGHQFPQRPLPVQHVAKTDREGQEVREQLDIELAKLKVIEHVRLKCICKECQRKAAEGGPQIATAEKPLVALTIEEVLASKVIRTDDTPVDVLDRSLKQTRQGRFWVYVGDEAHPYIVFDYTPNRKRDGPMTFLKDWGKDVKRFLQADAFGGYDGIYAGTTQPQRTLAAIRLELRQKLAFPGLELFKAWLEAQQPINGGPILPKSAMGQAITYALKQWDALKVYTTDGNLSIDNNVSEKCGLARIFHIEG